MRISDWSSDVCSSDLAFGRQIGAVALQAGLAVHDLCLARIGIADRPHQHLAEPGRDWSHRRLDTGGKLVAERIETLGDLLAVEIDVSGIVENHGDLAEAVARDRAGAFEPRNARKRGLARQRVV